MGIQGFTKFINESSHLYFENHELRDCTLIIDGHSVSCQLYNWKHWQFDARSTTSYGGDYDKYAYIVENFFGMLKEVKVNPIVVFDGGFEQRKLPTILHRMQGKINIADKLNPAKEKRQPNLVVFPLLLREAFKDVLRNLDIPMVMCEYEGDSEIASLAKSLSCSVLTFDSDFFFFGAQYIPFNTLDSKVSSIENWRTGTYKCITCKIYKIQKFLDTYPGIQENTLHLLPVLLGNDFINNRVFEKFLHTIKANVSKQEQIKLVLEWLQNETPESAIFKILKSVRSVEKKLCILDRIEKIVSGYYFSESKIFKYLNVAVHNDKKYKKVDFLKLRQRIKEESENNENESDSSESAEEIEDNKETEPNEEPETNSTNTKSEEDTEASGMQVDISETHEDKPVNVSNNDITEPEKASEEIVEKKNDSENIKENIDNSHVDSETKTENGNESPKNGVDDENVENGEVIESEDQPEKIEENEQPESPEISEEVGAEEEEEEENAISIFNFDATHLAKDDTPENPICKTFKRNLAKCLYPSSFMDILTQNKYYCIPQMENHCEKCSHVISFDILCAIHKILTKGSNAKFNIVARDEGTTIKWFEQEEYTVEVPSVEEIELLPLLGRRETLLKILNIDSSFVSLLEHFPTEWHTFLVALKFASSKTTFETPLVYSLILGFIILNYIDQRIGYYRSAERYKKKYYSYMQSLPPSYEHIPFRADKNCFYYFPSKDCIVFMQKVVHLFTVNPRETAVSYNKQLVHQMAQIQSVLLHIKYLNSLLKNPYPNLLIHQIFDATFIYNLTGLFKKKAAELENNYLNVFFKDCPSVLASLKYVLNMLNKQIIL